MVKKDIFRTLVPTALCVMLLGRQATFLPAYSQAHLATVNSGAASPCHHMNVSGFTPQFHHTGVQSPIATISSPSASNTQTTHPHVLGIPHLGAHGHFDLPVQNNMNGSSPSGNHTFHFFHNHQSNSKGIDGNTFAHQSTGLNGNIIGGYHAGYVMHHSENTISSSLAQQSGYSHYSNLAQQNGQSAGPITLHHHGANTLSSQSGNNTQTNGQTGYHHGNSSSQAAISLTGDKNANGSLSGSLSLPSLFDLNLGSNQLVASAPNSGMIIVGGHLGLNGSIEGGSQLFIKAGQLVTAAQFVAMQQALTGQQTIVLTNAGTARSGLVTLVAGLVGSLSSIEVPTHVVVDTVGFASNPFNVVGTTQVLGTLIALQQTANVAASLNSGSLFVGQSGKITDSLSGAGLFNSLFASNGLTLGILGNLTNQGTISSIGTLTVSANQIANVSTPTHTAVMTGQNLNLYSASGNVTNSGNLIATTGNVNFNAAVAQNININNTNGTIQALAGSINVRDTAYVGKANIDITGGNLLSTEANFNSGSGVVTANVNNLTGTFNVNAGEAHVTAVTDNLKLGNIDLSGDPSFFNMLGDVTFNTLSLAGQNAAIIAEGNIIGGSINTSSGTGNGGNILLIAGANVSNSNPNSGGFNNSTDTLTVKGGTSVGGYIDLSAATSLTSASTQAGSNGGDITAVAYGGTGTNAGMVTVPQTLTITTGGAGTGTNGNVSIIAGATSGTAINMGHVNASGGTGGGGNITLSTQAPVISGVGTMDIKDGSIINGTNFANIGTINTASINTGNLTSGGGSINILAGESITTGSLISNGSGPNGGDVTVTAANGTVQINGNISAGALNLTSGSLGSVGIANGTTTTATNINITTPSLVVGNNAAVTATAGDLNILSNGAGNTLTVNLGQGSTITGQSIIFNTTAAPGAINMNSGFGAISAIKSGSSVPGTIIFNGGSGAVTVSTESLNGYIVGNGSSVDLTVATGDLKLGSNLAGSLTSSVGDINATTKDTNGNIFGYNLISSAGKINLTSGNNGRIGVNYFTTITADKTITFNTPFFIAAGIQTQITSTNGDINFISNGTGNALTAKLGQGATYTGANINFNTAATPGAITVQYGQLFALKDVVLNGGSGDVLVNAVSISGNVAGNGRSIGITTISGNLSLGSGIAGGLTSSVGDISVLTFDPNGSISVNNVVSSAGKANLISGASAGTTVNPGASILANTGINLTTPVLINSGNISTATGDLNIQSNGPANGLTIFLGADSNLTAVTGNVNFNPINAGSIFTVPITGGFFPPLGTISANGGNGQVNLNIGSGTATVWVNSIAGIVQDPNANFVSPASGAVTLVVNSGQLTIGNFATSANNNILAVNVGNNGTLVTAGNLTAGFNVTLYSAGNAGLTISSGNKITAATDMDLYAPVQNINGIVTASTGNLNIQSNGLYNALTVILGAGSNLTAIIGNVNFNPFHAGSITIPLIGNFPPSGTISANGGNGQVNLNIGSGTATVWANSIAGIVQDPNANFASPESGAVLVVVNSGQLTIGNFATSTGNDIVAVNAGNNGTLVTAGNLTAGSNITLFSGNNGSLTINSGNIITAATDVDLYASVQNINGSVTASTGNLNIQSNGSFNELTVFLGAGSNLTAVAGNVNFNPFHAGSINIRFTGSFSSLGTISANGGTGQVNLNIGSGTAIVFVNSIAGIVQDPNANFASPTSGVVTLLVDSGQLTIGNFATSTGNAILALNAGSNGTVVTAGNLTAGSNITLYGGNNGSLTIGSGNKITAAIDVNLYAPVQNINGIVTASTGNITLESYTFGNSLVVNMGPAVGSIPTQLTATAGNVNFNTIGFGAITITGGPANGLISGNDVVMNGGLGAVNSNNQQIIGCIHVNGSSINMQTAVGDLDFCLGINTSWSYGSGVSYGSGGNITIAANGGAVNSGAIITNGSSAGNSAGNITISAALGINIGDINANGVNGASAGMVSLSSVGPIIGTYLSATGSGAGNGGSITTNSSTLALTGVDASGNSIDSNSGNTAGNITITTTTPQSFVVGNGSSSGNGTAGNISANAGTGTGGFIILANAGSGSNTIPNEVINGQITANSAGGSGGKIEFEVEPFGSAPLTVVLNGGLIEATNNANNLGRVGFNGGPGQAVNLIGSGTTVIGGEFIHRGNLDRITLEYLDNSGGGPGGGPITNSPPIPTTNNFSPNGLLVSASTSPSVVVFPPPYYPPTDFTPQGHFFYKNFQPREERPRPRFQLGLAYKRKTIAYIPGTKSYSHTFTGTEADRLANEGMQLISNNAANCLNINKGNILLSPSKKEIAVVTHEGTISMLPGAIAFVMESGHDVVVYNLRQSAPNQVSIMINTHRIVLQPGNMLVLTRQNVNDFEDIDADCHMVSYRGAQEVPTNEPGVKAFVAQYSIASAFVAVEPLQQLIASNDSQDKTAFDKIVKSAATLGDFTGTVDMAQLANLHREREIDTGAGRMVYSDEKVLDSATKRVATKNRPIQ